MPPIEDVLVDIFNSIGHLVCHQIPNRTLIIGNYYLPVCARCTGTYLGFYLGYLLLPMRREEACGPPNLWFTLLMLAPITIDVITQWVGLRTSTNELRLITGLLFGLALAPLLVYSLSQIPMSRKLPILRNFLPENVKFDDEDSWLGGKALGLGMLIAVALFFFIDSIVGSANYLFYWLLSPLIIISIVLHIFLLPIYLVISFFAHLRKQFSSAHLYK